MFGLRLNLTFKVLEKTRSKIVFVTCSVIKSLEFKLAIASSLIVSSSRQMPSKIWSASLFYMGLLDGSDGKPLMCEGL